MKIDFNQKIMTARGDKPLPKIGDEKGPYCLLDAAINALLAIDNSPGEEKEKRYKLVQKLINSENEVEMSLEELGLIKHLIGRHLGPLVVGQAWAMLEGATLEPK